MFVFGSGVLTGTQLNVATPTPINFGLVQKVSVNTSVSVKELYGQFAFPVAVGPRAPAGQRAGDRRDQPADPGR